MGKTFRAWDVDQAWLLPPSVHDLVPAGHAAHLVRETLDLGAIFDAYPEERGQPPYHPAMMTALLLYGYSRGLYASRRIESNGTCIRRQRSGPSAGKERTVRAAVGYRVPTARSTSSMTIFFISNMARIAASAALRSAPVTSSRSRVGAICQASP